MTGNVTLVTFASVVYAAAAGNAEGIGRGLLMVGGFLLAGFAAHVLGRRVHVPRVTLLLLLGFLAGPSALDLVPAEASEWFPTAARLALSMIGFQLGEQFLGKHLRQTGSLIFTISLVEVLTAALAVLVILLMIGTPLSLAILLASVAPATAPAATVDVIRESGANGPVSQATLGVVAIDDAWGVILFSLLAAAAEVVAGDGGSLSIVAGGVRELVGGAVLGCALGLPMAWLTGRVRPGELTLVETLGFVFLCSGLALLYEFSMILACMAMGATVSNAARHHERPFHAIEEVEQPFLMVFFLLAGFDFRVSELSTIGLLGATYLVARSAGKIIGAGFGARLAGAPAVIRKHIGWCLIPQAGVALGLALVIAERFSEGTRVLTVIVGTTVVFELLGPLFTRGALRRAGEIPDEPPGEEATES